MGLLGGITTSVTGVGAAVGTTCFTLKDDGTINTDNQKTVLATTLTSTASTTVGYIVNQHNLKKIHDQYSSAYIESLSDQELEEMYMKLGMLEAEGIEKNNNKTM